MYKSAIFLLISMIIIFSCNEEKIIKEKKNKDIHEIVSENKDTSLTVKDKYLVENLRINYEDHIENENSNFLIIPIILEEKYYDKGIPDYDYSNLLFYNPYTNETNLLINDSIDIISGFNIYQKPNKIKTDDYDYDYYHSTVRYANKGEFAKKYVFIEIIPWKTKKELKTLMGNGKSYETMKKAYSASCQKNLYLTDLNGKNLIQVTPAKTRIINWKIVKKSHFIIAELLEDSNNDNKFDSKDKHVLFKIDLKNPAIGNRIISKDFENTIKSNLLKGKKGLSDSN